MQVHFKVIQCHSSLNFFGGKVQNVEYTENLTKSTTLRVKRNHGGNKTVKSSDLVKFRQKIKVK